MSYICTRYIRYISIYFIWFPFTYEPWKPATKPELQRGSHVIFTLSFEARGSIEVWKSKPEIHLLSEHIFINESVFRRCPKLLLLLLLLLLFYLEGSKSTQQAEHCGFSRPASGGQILDQDGVRPTNPIWPSERVYGCIWGLYYPVNYIGIVISQYTDPGSP